MNTRRQKCAKMASESKPALLEEIGDFIECPVCLSTITDPPVYMCVRSHIFCEDCHTALKKDRKDCPVCKGYLAGNKNIPVERMLDSLPKTQCKNQGCSFKKVDSKKVESHEENCQHRVIKCLMCRKDYPLINLPEHLWDEHDVWNEEEEFKFGRNYSDWSYDINCTVGESIPLILEEDGKEQVFFLNYTVHDDGRRMHWISQSQKGNRKYKYTISLLCPKAYEDEEKIERLSTYSGLCIPVDVNIEAIINDMPCCSFPKVFLRQNLDQDEAYRFEWRINILK